MKICSFNVNGIRAINKKEVEPGKTLYQWIQEHQIDIIGFQETKAWEEQLTDSIKHLDGYASLSLSKPYKKGYSGVGLFVKSKIVGKHSCQFFQDDIFDPEGRINVFQTKDFTLLNVYFPNGASKTERLDYKMQFYEEFLKQCQILLQSGQHLIVMGDVNTAHREIDLAHPKENSNKSGFLPIEREWIDRFLSLGFYDTFRYFFPDKAEQYTWWDMKTRARERNIGWRIDYIYISKGLLPYLRSAAILSSIGGSDHCPIEVVLDL